MHRTTVERILPRQTQCCRPECICSLEPVAERQYMQTKPINDPYAHSYTFNSCVICLRLSSCRLSSSFRGIKGGWILAL